MPAPDEIKLRIAAAGICGTDLHILDGNWPCMVPVVVGHEFCGTVVEVGSRVTTLKTGDRVLGSNPVRTCGACLHCRHGNSFMCPARVSAGYMVDGAFAEYFCIPALQCHLLPSQVSFRQAALGEPLAVAVRAVLERSMVRPGDTVLVSGPGCVGLLTAQLAQMSCARVIVAGIDRDERRLAFARELGVYRTVNISHEDLVAAIRDCTKGEGVDIAYECAGVPASAALCLDATRKEGRVVLVGIPSASVQMELHKITLKELQVVGSYGYVWKSWQRAIELLARHSVKTAELISHEFPLRHFDSAFMAARNGSAVKVIFSPEMA